MLLMLKFNFTWRLFFQYADLAHVTYPALGKTIFIIFMILVPILLLNMLIAMMGNTYALVIERSEKEWMKQVTIPQNLCHLNLKLKFTNKNTSVGKNRSHSGESGEPRGLEKVLGRVFNFIGKICRGPDCRDEGCDGDKKQEQNKS
jgi:Ion transport protein